MSTALISFKYDKCGLQNKTKYIRRWCRDDFTNTASNPITM